MIRFQCPECGSAMEVDESFAGRPARCPTCGAGLKVPAKGKPAPARPAGKPPTGAARVRVGDEEVDVVPPLETMVLVSIACVALSVVVFLVLGLGELVAPPWTIAALLAFLVSLLGMIMAVPAHHSVRRSKGRKRGRTHAAISIVSGGVFALAFFVVFIVGLGLHMARPTCEQNLKHIYKALRAYAGDHHGAFPPALETLVEEEYLEGDHWLTCPAYKVPVGRPTYVLTPDINIRAKRPDGKPWWPPDTLIVSDGPPYFAHGDGKVRALLLGGEIRHVPHKEWAAYQERQTNRWNRTVEQIAAREVDGTGDADEPGPDEPASDPPASGKPGGPASEAAGAKEEST